MTLSHAFTDILLDKISTLWNNIYLYENPCTSHILSSPSLKY